MFVDNLKPQENQKYTAVFILIIINLILYVLDHILQINLNALYFHHRDPAWYQFITSLFCHGHWAHLSGNLFFLYIFGKLIEEVEGGWALVISYLVCGAGANLMSWLFHDANVVSLGASGAVFGLFTVSILIKLSFHWRNLLEILILGQFVISRMWNETQLLTQVDNVNRIAHLGGAMVGVGLMLALFWFEHMYADKHEKKINKAATERRLR
jgi:membrane associated rhomboid family serine protease